MLTSLGSSVGYAPTIWVDPATGIDFFMGVQYENNEVDSLDEIRKIPLSNKVVQAGRWEMPVVVPIRRIEGTVLGLLGFGNIPRLVAPKAKAFGMKVIAFDPYAKPELFKNAGVESVEVIPYDRE